MKLITTCFILFSIAFSGFCQDALNLGLKFGVNSSKLITNVDDIKNQNFEEYNVNTYQAGAFGRVSLGRIYVQPEVYFTTKGGIISSIDPSQLILQSQPIINYQTIDVPLLLGFKIINQSLLNLRVYTGPVFSYITAKDFSDEISDFKPDYLMDSYMGLQLGAGIDVWFITLDMRIETSANIFNNLSDFTAKNRVYILSAGIKLF
jgi:hypothetical protein